MPTLHERIAETDRQIERMRVRVQQQFVHAENLEHGRCDPEARKARALLDRMAAELSLLQRYRLSLYQEAVLADAPKKKVS
jgi:hypothetical protein